LSSPFFSLTGMQRRAVVDIIQKGGVHNLQKILFAANSCNRFVLDNSVFRRFYLITPIFL
ncbi:MAG: hypothetical protein IKD61_09545, partial [Oscillospiraceae bacterium]|nr:hypothetical protein [Oscillospiraceae bacterium]